MKGLLILFITCLALHAATAQDSPSSLDKLINFPSRFTDKINKKTDQLEEELVSVVESSPLLEGVGGRVSPGNKAALWV